METKELDILALIAASLGLIVSYAWNNLIQNTINYYFPEKDKSLIAQTLYTITLSFLAYIIIYYIIKYNKILKGIPETFINLKIKN